MTSSVRIGEPFARSEAVQVRPANLSGSREANLLDTSPRPSARKFTTKALVSCREARVFDRLSTQTSSSGGSADTELKALLVRPFGTPSESTVVTTVTPVGKEPTRA